MIVQKILSLSLSEKNGSREGISNLEAKHTCVILKSLENMNTIYTNLLPKRMKYIKDECYVIICYVILLQTSEQLWFRKSPLNQSG